MYTVKKTRETHNNNICEEILRERASVLSRAGMAVSDAINLLRKLDGQIQEKVSLMDDLRGKENTSFERQKRVSLGKEINASIEKFNELREKTKLRYYYLIVTREALGLRRHDIIFEIYKIPDKKNRFNDGHF